VTVEVRNAIDPLMDEWEALADRTAASPFLRPGWFEAWWGAFGSGVPEVVTVRRGGELTALFAGRRHGSVLESATNSQTPEFDVLAVDRTAAHELFEAVLARGARRVAVGYMTRGRLGFEELKAVAGGAGYRVMDATVLRSPFIELDGDWESYSATMTSRFRSELRRLRRRLEEHGQVRLEVTDGGDRRKALLMEGFRLEASGWKLERGTAINSSSEAQRFYTGVAAWAAARGLLRLVFLRLDERPLAFGFCLEDRHSHYVLKSGYDPKFQRFAPGKLLCRSVVERAFGEGLASVELLGNDDPWKGDWTQTAHERALVEAFAPSPQGLTEAAAHAAFHRYGKPRAKRLREWLRRSSRS
jgi:CelD/BcsL family acetyltransferase involved in cellulose biosynthesis